MKGEKKRGLLRQVKSVLENRKTAASEKNKTKVFIRNYNSIDRLTLIE